MNDREGIRMESNLETEEKGFIHGELIFTIYENVEEHFTIAKIKVTDTNEDYNDKEIVAKGHFTNLQQGMRYEFFGELITHGTYGKQYQVHAYQTFVPETKDGVVAFLSSDIFAGIGKKSAESIVDVLGENAVNKILEDPKVLDDVPRIREKTKANLVKKLKENHGFEKIAIHLTKYGIGLKMAQTLYKLYKQETMDYINQNPYQFVFDVEGFGFLTADKIAEINGMSKTDENRISASCLYVLEQATLDGHVYLPMKECIDKMNAILQVYSLTEEALMEQVSLFSEADKVVIENNNVYLPSLYYAETGFTTHIHRIMEENVDTVTPDAELMKMIGEIEEEEALNYGEEQFEAIKRAIHSKIMILTGGPGTGKTTVIKGILKAYGDIHGLSLIPGDYDSQADYPFVLTAPTGRAAKRLKQSTGINASTIHRLLGWDGNKFFEKNEHEKLKGRVLIIDEFSMVDTWLAYHLFKAIPDDMQVIFVGDEDQLPSVGPGQVLSDLLSSNAIPSVQLNEVYRQKEGSKIIELAHEIKQDKCTVNDIGQASDFSFIDCNEAQVVEVVTTVLKKAEDKGIHLNDIQILAPMYRTNAGINAINKAVQALVNPETKRKRERMFNDVIYRVGDRVIQLVNQPEDNVYNGDIGEIVAMFTARENEEKEEQIIISFDGNDVVYTRADYINFVHAFCISIHKSQGSEFPIVILPVVHAYRRMLRKNLLYTAITRSKSSLILCGQKDAFIQGITTLDTNIRYTTLQARLTSTTDNIAEDPSDKIAEDTSEEKALEPPLDDAAISPFDFM